MPKYLPFQNNTYRPHDWPECSNEATKWSVFESKCHPDRQLLTFITYLSESMYWSVALQGCVLLSLSALLNKLFRGLNTGDSRVIAATNTPTPDIMVCVHYRGNVHLRRSCVFDSRARLPFHRSPASVRGGNSRICVQRVCCATPQNAISEAV